MSGKAGEREQETSKSRNEPAREITELNREIHLGFMAEDAAVDFRRRLARFPVLPICLVERIQVAHNLFLSLRRGAFPARNDNDRQRYSAKVRGGRQFHQRCGGTKFSARSPRVARGGDFGVHAWQRAPLAFRPDRVRTSASIPVRGRRDAKGSVCN